jgi:hypothetical protein
MSFKIIYNYKLNDVALPKFAFSNGGLGFPVCKLSPIMLKIRNVTDVRHIRRFFDIRQTPDPAGFLLTTAAGFFFGSNQIF